MGLWRSSDPDVLTKTAGGGCLTLIGLPFLLGGLLLIACVFIPGKVRGGDDLPWYVGFTAGSLFGLPGALLVFGRARERIDRRQAVVESSFSAIATFRRKERPLGLFQHVSVTREVRSSSSRSGGSGKTTVYPVRLVGDGDKIDWETLTSPERARRSAEDLAKFVRLPLRDSSTGTERIREADTLDESVGARASREGLYVEVPVRPSQLRSIVTRHGETIRVTFPRQFRKAVGAATVWIVLGYFLMTSPDVMTDAGEAIRRLSPHFDRWPFAEDPTLLVVIPFVLLAVAWVAGSITRVSALANADSLRVEVQRPLVRWTTTIPASELEELFLSGEKIVARSDRKTLYLGGNTDHAEAEYLQAVLKAALLGQTVGL